MEKRDGDERCVEERTITINENSQNITHCVMLVSLLTQLISISI